VLAAGESSRFGSPKQLVEVGGVPLVRRTVTLAQGVCEGPVIVVVGAASRRVVECLEGLHVRIVTNPRWAEGLAGSLRAGFAAIEADRRGVLVLPCDLPRLRHDDLSRLVEAWAGRAELPAAARFEGVLGIPAILPTGLLPRIDLTAADQGAREFLRRADVDVTAVPMAAAARDLDEPEGIART
jgi:molybdenum cofactor cytidylyltransferase